MYLYGQNPATSAQEILSKKSILDDFEYNEDLPIVLDIYKNIDS